jgi:hypothetical protein
MMLLPQTSGLASGRLLRCGVTVNHPSHRRIVTEPVGVVAIVISGNAAKRQLPRHSGQTDRCGPRP